MNHGDMKKAQRLTAPEKGSFPLDHDGDCKEKMKLYMACLARNEMVAQSCRGSLKSYLECRMNEGLMSREDFLEFGFKENEQDSNDTKK
mmetsp:Transcript_7994/g.12097  ORF Transcript_7994/g.12097 Transcript_7994/m.12097 type:complete len:89 (+) Transcript_7994:65-331(+)